MIVKVKHYNASWMYKTDSAKQHFCGSITHVVQYVLLCLFLAVSFKTLKHILLNAAEDTRTLQAFLLSFQVKSCRHCLFFCGTFMWRTAQTHTHKIFLATLTLNGANPTIFCSYCFQWQYLKLIWNQPLIWSNIFDRCYEHLFLFFFFLLAIEKKVLVVCSAGTLELCK